MSLAGELAGKQYDNIKYFNKENSLGGKRKKSGKSMYQKYCGVFLQVMDLRAVFLFLALFGFPCLLHQVPFVIRKTIFKKMVLGFPGGARG